MNETQDLRYWTITRAHDETGVSREELYRLVKDGTLQSIRTGEAGRTLMVRVASLAAYLLKHKQPTQLPEPVDMTTYARRGETKLC